MFVFQISWFIKVFFYSYLEVLLIETYNRIVAELFVIAKISAKAQVIFEVFYGWLAQPRDRTLEYWIIPFPSKYTTGKVSLWFVFTQNGRFVGCLG